MSFMLAVGMTLVSKTRLTHERQEEFFLGRFPVIPQCLAQTPTLKGQIEDRQTSSFYWLRQYFDRSGRFSIRVFPAAASKWVQKNSI